MPTPNGSHDEPIFDLDDGSDFPDDLNSVVTFAKLTGNVKTGTLAQMNALSGAKVWNGLLFVNTEDGNGAVYSYQAAFGWRIIGAPVIAGTISAGSNVTIDGRSYLKRRGNQVTMLLAVGRTTGTFGANQTIATIPAAFRPTTGTVGVMGVYTAGAAPGTCGVYVNTDGTVAINGYSTTSGSASMVVLLSYEI